MASRSTIIRNVEKILEYLSPKSESISNLIKNNLDNEYMMITKYISHSDLTNSGKRNGTREGLDKNYLYYLTAEEMEEIEKNRNRPFESAKQSNIFLPSEFYEFLGIQELKRREGMQTTHHSHPIINNYADVYLVNDTLKYFDIEYTKKVFKQLNKNPKNWNYDDYKIELSNSQFTPIQLTHAIHGVGTNDDKVFHKLRRSIFKNDTIIFLLSNDHNSGKKSVYIILEKNPKFYTLIGESNDNWEKYLILNNKLELYELLKKDNLSSNENIKTRKNQNKWRNLLAEEMMNYTPTDGEIFCPLTYITTNFENAGTLFRASHIKEFASCNQDEAFDINNGIIMVANADALFDKHLITIDEKGNIIFSFLLDNDQRLKNNLRLTDKVFKNILNNERKKYLEYHRNKFKEKELERKMGILNNESDEETIL